MNESEHNSLSEKGWRKPTPAEAEDLHAWLSKHPEAQADWETELRLTEAINHLPDAPVPSNFTARVLQAVERESAVGSRRRGPFRWWSLRGLLPRTAAATLVLGAGLLAYHEHTVTERRAELAQSVKMVPALSAEVLQNFETIRKMGSATGPDRELIALMQ